MTKATSPKTIICFRSADMRLRPIPGSTAFACERCGYEVMMSPATRAMFNRGDSISCMECDADQAKAQGSPFRTLVSTADQIAEIKAHVDSHSKL